MGKYGRARQATDGNTIRPMRIACRITKAKDNTLKAFNTTFFATRKWLRERALILRYTSIALLFRRRFSPAKMLYHEASRTKHTHTHIRQIQPLSVHYSPCTTLIASQHTCHSICTQHSISSPLRISTSKGCVSWTSPICAAKQHVHNGLKWHGGEANLRRPDVTQRLSDLSKPRARSEGRKLR